MAFLSLPCFCCCFCGLLLHDLRPCDLNVELKQRRCLIALAGAYMLWSHAVSLFPFYNLTSKAGTVQCSLPIEALYLSDGVGGGEVSHYWPALLDAYLRFLSFNLLCNGYSPFPSSAAPHCTSPPCYHSKYAHTLAHNI